MKLILKTLLLTQLWYIFVLSSSHNNKGKRLIKVRGNESAKWVTEEEIKDILRTTGFLDLTRHGKDMDFPRDRVGNNSEPYPTVPKHREVVQQLLKNVKIDRIKKFIKNFSSFHSRHYKIYYGPNSANEWLLSEVNSLTKLYPGVEVATIASVDYPQKNIIARIQGSDPTLKSEIIILGAHQDSINYAGEKERSPGSDDNASGSSVVMELLRAILESGRKFKRTMEFHWYAAEEVGVLGSDTVSETYRNGTKNVIGMLNLDVLGHQSSEGKVIGLYTDDASRDMISYTEMIINNYCQYKWRERKCGYYCSDHSRWQTQGYPAIFVAEVMIFPSIHSESDTIDQINFEQISEFCKLAMGFGVELAGSA